MTKKINLKITIEETAERHPVPVLGTDYKVKIIYKNIKVAELDVEDKITYESLCPNCYYDKLIKYNKLKEQLKEKDA